MKVLITGGSGNLGRYLISEFQKNQNEVIATVHSKNIDTDKVKSVEMDLANPDNIRKLIDEYNPQILIHAGAVSNPQKAERLEQDYVRRVNIESAAVIAEVCNSINCRLIFTSTDLVYDGNQGDMLNESSRLNPKSFYAETKLQAEKIISETSNNFLVLRMSLMYGITDHSSDNHFSKMYYRLLNGEAVKLFTDQFRTPLALFDAARIINHLTASKVSNEIINCGGNERVSRYEMGKILIDLAGFDESLIIPIKMNDIPNIPVVEDVSMNIDKLKSVGIVPLGIIESINHLLNGL
ncbi:MAG: SDR family oxidoreductase [Melioribacteraceae bacterium]|nr:SDR family oxidoreductase [Melioribacteraceae bacterium]MCF8353272.1 SDR family oxidoreductase [Melioribacteraceae bacterium]MCF8394842.1 SDR family oxidoreductase [Melioribacteraceae bacterium]MCF8418799.1 SDR family oxidoreductase [Melioribacteraceae bacterium]